MRRLRLVGATDMFLGDYGAVSQEASHEVFPILINSSNNVIQNEHDWIMEAFVKIGINLTRKEKDLVLDFINEYKNNPRKAIAYSGPNLPVIPAETCHLKNIYSGRCLPLLTGIGGRHRPEFNVGGTEFR